MRAAEVSAISSTMNTAQFMGSLVAGAMGGFESRRKNMEEHCRRRSLNRQFEACTRPSYPSTPGYSWTALHNLGEDSPAQDSSSQGASVTQPPLSKVKILDNDACVHIISHLTWFRVLTGSGHLRALRLRGPCGAVLRRLGNGNELGLGTIDSRNGR